MKGWRDKFDFIGPEEPCTKGDMTASALIQHVDSKSECCPYHRYISKYLRLFFCADEGEYLGINVGHYAFYGLSDPKRKQAYDNEMDFLELKKTD